MRLYVHQNTFETRRSAAWVSVLRNQHVGFRKISHHRTLPDVVSDRPKGRHDAGVIVNVDQSAVCKAQKVEIARMHEKSPPVRLTTVAVFVAVNNGSHCKADYWYAFEYCQQPYREQPQS